MSKPRCWAKIRIGGSLNQATLDLLRDELDAALGSTQKAQDAIDECLGSAPLEVEDHEVAYGEFHDLEDFCKANNLTYTRECNGTSNNIAAGITWWSPEDPVSKYNWLNRDEEQEILITKGNLDELFHSVDIVLSKDLPADLPTLINDERKLVAAYAKDILARGHVDPYAFCKEYFQQKYAGPADDFVPTLKLI